MELNVCQNVLVCYSLWAFVSTEWIYEDINSENQRDSYNKAANEEAKAVSKTTK